jgi:glucosamine kinase
MILIADSGSTKCDWAHLSNEGQVEKFQTLGLNPQIQSASTIRETLKSCREFDAIKSQTESIYLYISGSSTSAHKAILNTLLLEIFDASVVIEIENDLQGAARASLGRNAGLVGILGTGSNLAYFNGETLRHKTPALGYILGDEGSGSNMGKTLITHYLYNEIPEDLNDKFKDSFPYNKDEVLIKVYQEERPNAFLASCVPFVVENKEHPFMANLIKSSFAAFIERHVMTYAPSERATINLVGSIPYYLNEHLKETLNNYGIQLGLCIPKPIDHLIEYHLKAIQFEQ